VAKAIDKQLEVRTGAGVTAQWADVATRNSSTMRHAFTPIWVIGGIGRPTANEGADSG